VSRAKETNLLDVIGIVAQVQAPQVSCSGAVDLKVPQTVNGIVHWLLRQRVLIASVPRRVTIGGFKGYSLTLRKTPRGGIRCGGVRSFPIFAGRAGSNMEGFLYSLGLSEQVKLYLLTVKGVPLAILADTSGRHGPSLTTDTNIISHFHFAKF
jgi:hypothetical protein